MGDRVSFESSKEEDNTVFQMIMVEDNNNNMHNPAPVLENATHKLL